MEAIKQYQVRGVPGRISRIKIDNRTIDYWAPATPTQHLLVAHDGQNVFDRNTSTHRGKTWEMAQSAIRVSHSLGITPPAIIAIWNSSTEKNPWGRALELSPQQIFQSGINAAADVSVPFEIEELNGDQYFVDIVQRYIPEISSQLKIAITPEKSAIIGSSMGALASLYGIGLYPNTFHTCLALSPHWTVSDETFVDALVERLPNPGTHKIWMSFGTKGIDRFYGPLQRYADEAMHRKGYAVGRDFATTVYPRTGHNEKSWARYLDDPMKFWLTTLL